jgi:hypothetical protein
MFLETKERPGRVSCHQRRSRQGPFPAHLGLDKQSPHARQVSIAGRIVKIPHLGGLHHRYKRIAA